MKMSNKLTVRKTKENVTERVLLKRLKNEAKKRNCSVVLHKARVPIYGYYNVSTEDGDDQQVPNVTDMEADVIPAWLPSPSNGDEFPTGVACRTNHDARNIFQSIKSFSGYDYSTEENGENTSTQLQTAPADSLFLTDLGTTLSDPTKEDGEVNTAMDSVIIKEHLNVEGDTMKKEHVEEVNLEETEDKWCPLTPTSESERDTSVTSVNVPDDGIVDYSQPNLETNSGTTLLIKECWSLAGKDSFWSNPSDVTNDCNQTNKYSTSTPPDYVNENIYMESNTAKQTSAFNTEVTCSEIVQTTQDAITFAPEESTFHQEHSDNDVDVKTLQRTCEVTDQCSNQTTKQTFSEADAKQVHSSLDDVQETSGSIKDNMVNTPTEKPIFPQVQLSQIGKEQFINAGAEVAEKTLVVTPTQHMSLQQSDYNINLDYHSNTEMNIDQHLVTSLSYPGTIEQLHSKSLGNIVASIQTCKATENSSTLPKPSTAANSITPEDADRIARVPEISQNMEIIPISGLTMVSPKCMLDNNQHDGDIEKSKPVAGVNPIKNENETSPSLFNASTSETFVGKIQQGDTMDMSATHLTTKEEKFTVNKTKPDSLQTSLENANKTNATTLPNQSNEIPSKRPRGRPKGCGRPRGRGHYGYTHGFIPFHHMVNLNNPMTTCINNINQTPHQNPQKVIVPIELPSKGVIGMVSETTYSEIQKHLSASDNVVPIKAEQKYQPVYQGQPHKPDGGICVPIYDSDVFKCFQKTISNGDSILQTPMQIHSNLHETSTVQTSGPTQMIELQRPPPAYQPTLHSNINSVGAYQSPIENNLPVAVNEKEMNRNCFQVESESVLALPRDAITNMPVLISIPKSKYNRKGSNIKGSTTLTVREQLLEKMRGRLYQRRNFTGTTRLQQASHVTNAPTFQILPPTPSHPSSIPNGKGISFSPLQQTHSISQEIRGGPPFPVYRPPTTISPQVSFNHSFVATPQYHFQSDPQTLVSHKVIPIKQGVVHNVTNNSLVSNSVAMLTTNTPQFQTSNILKLGLPTTISASNIPSQVTISNTYRPAPRHNAVQLRKPDIENLKQQNIFYSHNLLATQQLQTLNSHQQQTFSALDLSMRSKNFHSNGTVQKPEETYPAPLDLSKKVHPTVQIPDVKCTPLDLSRKEQDGPAKYPEPVIQSPDLNAHEVIPEQNNVSSESLQSVSVVEPEQSLSVLAAAAELLEYKPVSTTGDVNPPDQSPSPKMAKIKVKFNSKQKLWHLVPITKDLQTHAGQKAKRGRPPKGVKESTVGKLHHCQFCNFSHFKKHEVRVHIKLAHFAKFKKDPKTNKLYQVDKEKMGNKNPAENQEPKPTKAYEDVLLCKHCDFTSAASYLLQRHVEKWHPNDTSDDCKSIEREVIEELKKQRHTCDICGASYLYINGLRSHEHRHHLLLAHQCLMCGLKFKSKGTLQRHQILKNHLVEENKSVSTPGV